MQSLCVPTTANSSETLVVRRLAAALTVLMMLCLHSAMAVGQCTLSSPTITMCTVAANASLA